MPKNAACSFLIVFIFIQNHVISYCQAIFDAPFPYHLSGMTTLPANPMGYAHARSMYHMPEDKMEVIVVGDKARNQHQQQQHHHHHHHHHKNVHHHHHGHRHSHGHNHNHDHKHDHGHNHDHNHNHDHAHAHKHAHGHKHQHNHAHGHRHNHDHLHGHKHAHILLRKQLHGHRQKHINQQDHNDNYGSSNDQYDIKGNSYEQHHFKKQINDHQGNQQHSIQQQNHYSSQYPNQSPPIKQQQYNKHTSNNPQHNNFQHSNYDIKYPDHVTPSYVSTNSDNGISHNENHNNGKKEHNFKVLYDEPEKDDVQQSHYEHSASNENTSHELKQEDNNNDQDANSHSSENPPDTPEVKTEGINKSVSSSERDDALPRFSHRNINNMPFTAQRITKASPPRKNYNPRFRHANVPNDHNEAQRLKEPDQISDELFVEPQVHYGVRLGKVGSSNYPKEEASISSVSFLQENGEIITVGDDDPYVSVGRPMKLEDSSSQESYHSGSLESRLSAGRMSLTPAQDYRASIGKIDEVFNIPIFN